MTGPESAVVRLDLERPTELFTAPDPAPLEGRHETRSGIDRILDDPGITGSGPPLTLELRLPEPVDGATDPESELIGIRTALRGSTDHRIAGLDAELARIRRRGLIELAAGSVFLAACLGLSGLVAAAREDSFATEFLAEGLVIVGWIALWHPVDLLLFEPWSRRRDRAVLRRIGTAEVRIHPLQNR